MKKGINVLSLFDGISCGLQALKQAGIQVDNYYASEVDKYAIQIAMKNHPEIIQLGDVTKWKEWDLPKIDLLIGGSPCQDLSNAGKMAGFKGARSGLFFDFVDIKNSLGPTHFLLENVNMKQEFQNVINEYLGFEPVNINSNLLSAQNRNRLYWSNFDIPTPEDNQVYWCDVFEENADCFYYTEGSFNWLFKDEKRKKKYKEYQRDEKVKMQMLEASHYKGYSNQRCFGVSDNKGVRYISPRECERVQGLPDDYTSGVSNSRRYQTLGNSWTSPIIEHIFKQLPL